MRWLRNLFTPRIVREQAEEVARLRATIFTMNDKVRGLNTEINSLKAGLAQAEVIASEAKRSATQSAMETLDVTTKLGTAETELTAALVRADQVEEQLAAAQTRLAQEIERSNMTYAMLRDRDEDLSDCWLMAEKIVSECPTPELVYKPGMALVNPVEFAQVIMASLRQAAAVHLEHVKPDEKFLPSTLNLVAEAGAKITG